LMNGIFNENGPNVVFLFLTDFACFGYLSGCRESQSNFLNISK